MLQRTCLTVEQHQRLTIERYNAIRAAVPSHIHILPVLQGYDPHEYVAQLRAYGDRLTPGMWVGVGSVCKRNGKPDAIEAVLRAIKTERPARRLHGFGLKLTALSNQFYRYEELVALRLADQTRLRARLAQQDPRAYAFSR